MKHRIHVNKERLYAVLGGFVIGMAAFVGEYVLLSSSVAAVRIVGIISIVAMVLFGFLWLVQVIEIE